MGNWPGVSTPGFSSTVFGLRGKRSADADAHYGFYGYGLRPYYGYGLTGVAGHPTGTSYVARSVQGLSLRGKRSAEAEPEADAYYGGMDTEDITVVDTDTDILWDTGDTDMVDSTDTVDTTTVRLQFN